MLSHEDGMPVSPAMARVYRNQQYHDPSDINSRARGRLAYRSDPGGNPVPQSGCAMLRGNCGTPGGAGRSTMVQQGLNAELDKFTVWPEDEDVVGTGRVVAS